MPGKVCSMAVGSNPTRAGAGFSASKCPRVGVNRPAPAGYTHKTVIAGPKTSPQPPRPPLPGGHPGVGVRPTWEPYVAAFLLLFFIGFGVAVEHRSAFSER